MAFGKEKYIAGLISKYVQGTLTPGEREELDAWRNDRTANEDMFKRMLSRSGFEANIERFVKSGRQAAKEWRLIENRGPGRKKQQHRRFLRYAAAIAILTVSATALYTLREKSYETVIAAENGIAKAEFTPILLLGDSRRVELTPEANSSLGADRHFIVDTADMTLVYETSQRKDRDDIAFASATHTLLIPRGSDYRIVLSDNTVVYLNSETSLTYPAAFGGGERKVQLRGEAYFEVAKDHAHPFIVTAGEVDIIVTGTSFGVRAYGNESIIRTVLKSGSVSVNAENQQLVLNPDMQATFDRQTKTMIAGPADANILLAWKNGWFAYDGSTLEEIFNDLERWYDFKVTYADEQSRHLRYSLDIRKHAGFAGILNIIRATQKVDFEVSGNSVVVKMKE